MIWRWLEPLWLDAKEQKERQRLSHAESERQRRERLEISDKRREREEMDDLLLLIVSEQIRRALRELADDIDNAITATRHAYARACLDRDKARSTLEEAQRHALTLRDGRRVYFDQNGALYTENYEQLTDADVVAEAGLLIAAQPQATTYETFVAANAASVAADERVHQIAETLDQLDTLRERIHSGTRAAGSLRRWPSRTTGLI